MNNELEIYFAQFGYQLFSSALWVKSKYVNLYFSESGLFPIKSQGQP